MAPNGKLLVVVVGPTAVGKTAVSIEIAKRFRTEIVSADSRQLYRELNIGTAKPTTTELAEVQHHLINSHTIAQEVDAAAFAVSALESISRIFKEHSVAVLCGGSGLYVRAVTDGFDDIPAVDDGIRQDLVKKYEQFGLEWLQTQMSTLDPGHYASIDQQNPHRLIRALEVILGTGQSISSFQKKTSATHNFRILKIGLELPREILYQRIEARMDQMIADGLFEEAKGLYELKDKNALQTVGYQEVFDFIDGKFSYEETVGLLKRNSRRYAKRQMTWFRKDQSIKWFNPEQLDQIIELVRANC